MAQIYFSSHSYCLLPIVTQCSFLIYSRCSSEATGMPFNFQPTIFSAKIQYKRPCKYSRPVGHIGHGVYNTTEKYSVVFYLNLAMCCHLVNYKLHCASQNSTEMNLKGIRKAIFISSKINSLFK